MADVVLAPWVMQHWVFAYYGKDPEIPEQGKGGEDEEWWNRWRTWVKSVEGRETVTRLMSDREHYRPIYQRYAEDKAQADLLHDQSTAA